MDPRVSALNILGMLDLEMSFFRFSIFFWEPQHYPSTNAAEHAMVSSPVGRGHSSTRSRQNCWGNPVWTVVVWWLKVGPWGTLFSERGLMWFDDLRTPVIELFGDSFFFFKVSHVSTMMLSTALGSQKDSGIWVMFKRWRSDMLCIAMPFLVGFVYKFHPHSASANWGWMKANAPVNWVERRPFTPPNIRAPGSKTC